MTVLQGDVVVTVLLLKLGVFKCFTVLQTQERCFHYTVQCSGLCAAAQLCVHTAAHNGEVMLNINQLVM